MAAEAIKKSGKRGIICGMGKPANLPKNIIATDSIPHSWLFERVSAVCHHGGAGTTAAGFKAGISSIIIPFSNDQFAWAHRAYDLGVGAKPIPKKELSADKLADAMKNKIAKSVFGIILLTISPFFFLTIVGILYVAFKMTRGASFSAGAQSLINFIYSLVPFFSYLTTLPMIIVSIVLIFKYWKKILNVLQKR